MRLFVVIFSPIIAAFLIGIWEEKSVAGRNALVLLPGVIGFLLIYSLVGPVLAGLDYWLTLVNIPTFALQFHADEFSIYLGLLMTFLWVLTDIYSFGYMAHAHSQTRYYAALTLALAAAMGVVFSANLITFFVFFEMLTLSVYPLVIHEETKEAYNSGKKYAAYLLTGGASVLLGIVATFVFTKGNVTFTPGGIPALAQQSDSALMLLFLLFTFGFGFKAAIVPLHTWLPEAMVAPTSVSAILHAVAVVNVGICGFYRVIYNVFGMELFSRLNFHLILGGLAIITILFAAIVALAQDGIKKMLAYSTINQLSYLLLGLVSTQMLGMLGALLHIVYHSFMKITLFYCAGAIISQTKRKYISEMAGLAKRMPITMVCFAVAAAGIVGIPPVCGWLSKWYLIQGYFTLRQPLIAGVFILSCAIELGYFTPPIFLAFFKKGMAEEKEKGVTSCREEAPKTMLIPIVIVTIISVLFGIWGLLPHRLASPALVHLLGLGK